MEFRTINWHRDGAAIRSIDTSFTTDRVYVLKRMGLCFSLIEEVCVPPITKSYEIASAEGDSAILIAIAAYEGDAIHGLAIVKEEAWNRRALITDFYLSPIARGQGLGRKMMEAVYERVASANVRVLWVETQNVNLPAIKFYRSVGFEVCGFDSSLYDIPLSAEVALYLAKSIEKQGPNFEGSAAPERAAGPRLNKPGND